MNFHDIQTVVHRTAIEHGWWAKPRSFGELIALMHSELSEALEADREDRPWDIPEELADAVIRIMDAAEYMGLDLESAILQKNETNRARPFRHGKRY